MGDETIQFASRYSTAVSCLAALAGDDGYRELARLHGAKLAAVVRDALDAVQAVYDTATKDVRNWPEQRRRALAQIAAMREALDRSGMGEDVRGMARALVAIIEPRPARR
ncbi:MAG TPA: hypothetical protein VLU43_10320 [Anaeromyxobacteraceae bacterium]|nr:hypothetical protein [Anaeromyxobacteraceae bacterium]